MRRLLAVSIGLNAVTAAVVASIVRRRGGLPYLRERFDRSPTDFAAVAAGRFPPVTPGQVVFVGDSHLQNAPLAEMISGVSQRGISGMATDELAGWIQSLDGAKRVVIWSGANDLARGFPVSELVARFERLLDRCPAEPVVLAIPTRADHLDVGPANEALEELCHERGVRFVSLPAVELELDGVHLTHAGYLQLAPVLREVV